MDDSPVVCPVASRLQHGQQTGGGWPPKLPESVDAAGKVRFQR
jgi:hypothetical protein